MSETLIKIVTKFVGSEFGIFDDSDPRKQPIRATSVVDVTPLCCGIDNKQKLLRYGWKLDGTLVVQLLKCFSEETLLGERTNLLISKEEMCGKWCNDIATDSRFVACCNKWGVFESEDVRSLAKIIFENAPKKEEKN